MRWLFLIMILAAPAYGQECPAVPDHEKQLAVLIQQSRIAPDEQTARRIMDRMWLLWRDAPDQRAQDMLDRGIERREAYDFEAAENTLSDLIAYCPDYAEGYNQRAFVFFLRSDYANALEDLERALELSPNHIAAMSGKALSLMGLGRVKAAQTTLRQALALNPWLPERGLLQKPMGEEL